MSRGPANASLARRYRPDQWRRRLRRRLFLSWALGLALLGALAWADHRGWLWRQPGDRDRYHQRQTLVTHVLDGDTLDVAIPDGNHATTRVRLWGINAPEIAHPQYGRHADQPFGPEAAEAVRQWALHQKVRLILEPTRTRDAFGRLLAHVELIDGSILNERLLEAGLAWADHRPGNSDFAHQKMERYAQLERQAQIDKRGLWFKESSRRRELEPSAP